MKNPRPHLFILLLLFLLIGAGCAGQALTPVSGSQVETQPGASPTAAATLLPFTPSTAPTRQATQTPSSAATSVPLPVVRIKNAESGAYLYEKDGQALLGEIPVTDPASLWLLETYQGSKRLQNCASGNYLSIEHLLPYVEVLPIYPDWKSPLWTLEGDPAEGPVVIRSVWHNWQVLFLKDGRVQYDRAATTTDNARWSFEFLAGAPPASADTPTPFVISTPANPPDSRGAGIPWVELEAEAAQTNGEILAPDRTFGTIAAESSGRSAVRLVKTGDYVAFKVEKPANAIVVRYVIPDSEDGKGLDATLSLYVDGVFHQKLPLRSRYAWSYGGEQATFNVPKAGGAHHFYDETRALTGDIPAGATLKLQMDVDDTAAYVVVDLIDLEQAAAPKTRPENYLSIVEDCGAVPDDGKEDGPAIKTCIDRARAAHTGVWIPAGTFESAASGFTVSDVTIQGAGMWHSILHGFFARFTCTGNNCRYADFAILGETVLRDDKSPENGFNGGAGTGSRLENIWVEHTKVGYWVGGGTDGLVITGSRFRNLFADGVNFCDGTSHSVVENSHFRNTGDDALASWSPSGQKANTGNVFRFNTVQIPWRANCFAIYGGRDNRIENNLCADVVTYPGILIAQQFNSTPFAGLTTIQRNTLIRAGGPMFHDQHGALKVWAAQGEISGLVVKELLIDSATFSGIELEGSYPITNALFEQITIQQPGAWGIFFRSDAAGEVTFSTVTVSQPGKEGLLNYAPKLYFKLNLGAGNSGWYKPSITDV